MHYRDEEGGGVCRCDDCEAAHHEMMDELEIVERPVFPPDPEGRRALGELAAAAKHYNAAVQFMRQTREEGGEAFANAAKSAADAKARLLSTSWVWRAPLAAVPRPVEYAPASGGGGYAALADFADAAGDIPEPEILPDAS